MKAWKDSFCTMKDMLCECGEEYEGMNALQDESAKKAGKRLLFEKKCVSLQTIPITLREGEEKIRYAPFIRSFYLLCTIADGYNAVWRQCLCRECVQGGENFPDV